MAEPDPVGTSFLLPVGLDIQVMETIIIHLETTGNLIHNYSQEWIRLCLTAQGARLQYGHIGLIEVSKPVSAVLQKPQEPVRSTSLAVSQSNNCFSQPVEQFGHNMLLLPIHVIITLSS